MASPPVRVKQEEEPISLRLYSIPPEWEVPLGYSAPVSASPHSFVSVYSEVPISHFQKKEPSNHSIPSFITPPLPPLKCPIRDDSKPLPETHSLSPPSPAGLSRFPRVPRPPNAFMLFRSHFLKYKPIPNSVEKRQQNLSRIVGDVWNMMDKKEKKIWYDLAETVLLKHKAENPDYKFTPAPRGSRRSKEKARIDESVLTDEKVREIRETYTRFVGPSPLANRKRSKKDHRVGKLRDTPFPASLSAFSESPTLASHPFSQARSSSPLPIPIRAETFTSPTPVRLSASLGFHAESSLSSIRAGTFSPPTTPRPFASLAFNQSTSEHLPTPKPYANTGSSALKPTVGSEQYIFPSGQDNYTDFVPQPYGITQWLPAPIEAKIQSPLHPHLAGPIASSSSIQYLSCEHGAGNISVATNAYEFQYPNDNPVSNAPLSFTEDLLSCLMPYDNSHSNENNQLWLPEPADLENWDFDFKSHYASQFNDRLYTFPTEDAPNEMMYNLNVY